MLYYTGTTFFKLMVLYKQHVLEVFVCVRIFFQYAFINIHFLNVQGDIVLICNLYIFNK